MRKRRSAQIKLWLYSSYLQYCGTSDLTAMPQFSQGGKKDSNIPQRVGLMRGFSEGSTWKVWAELLAQLKCSEWLYLNIPGKGILQFSFFPTFANWIQCPIEGGKTQLYTLWHVKMLAFAKVCMSCIFTESCSFLVSWNSCVFQFCKEASQALSSSFVIDHERVE